MKTKARLIAYYLPQFHPIPENDLHWGKGFTEWTNVAKAKPLYKGHYQPHLPTELGYYDLRVPEVRKAQAALAKEYGIEGFCYWHYWFGDGKRLLEMPFEEVMKTGEPDFPFCLCWANHTWSKAFMGSRTIIMEQKYQGVEDYTRHFYALLSAFRDKRYIKVEEKLLFVIFAPSDLPDGAVFTDTWRTLASKEGIADFHFVGIEVREQDRTTYGLDAITSLSPHPFLYLLPLKLADKITHRIWGKSLTQLKQRYLKRPLVYSYKAFVQSLEQLRYSEYEYPVVLPNWDHSPRSSNRAFILHDSTPALFGEQLAHCIEKVENRPKEKRLVFIKAWNEWAEGNYLEPEARYGRGYLEEIKKRNISVD